MCPALDLEAGDRQTSPPRVLARARALTEAVIRDQIAALHPSIAAIAEYHLGWRDAAGTAIPAGNGGGKGVCLALPILAAEAVGADASTGVPGGVALELVHTFTHLHDDIMDGDTRRRHRESAWKVFGVGPAILTGDTLFAQAVRMLAAVPGTGAAAVRCLIDACMDLSTGQALDLAYEKRSIDGPGAVELDGYLAMADGKTGALYGCSLSIGAVLAGSPQPVIDSLHAAGRHLGLVAQVVNDINGIWGDPAVTGKPVLGDLLRRKKSLPVVAALAAVGNRPAMRRRLLDLWSASDCTEVTARDLLATLDEVRARDLCAAQADRHHQRALAHLDEVALPEPVREELSELAGFILRREG